MTQQNPAKCCSISGLLSKCVSQTGFVVVIAREVISFSLVSLDEKCCGVFLLAVNWPFNMSLWLGFRVGRNSTYIAREIDDENLTFGDVVQQISSTVKETDEIVKVRKSLLAITQK